jgi:hypothetical protein
MEDIKAEDFGLPEIENQLLYNLVPSQIRINGKL